MKEQVRRIDMKNILILVLVFLLGWQLGQKNLPVNLDKKDYNVQFVNSKPPKEIKIDFKLFWDTWDLVSRLYLDKSAIDPNKLFYGAISGMVSAIGDPYTVFLPPEQQKSSKEELNGSFEGVGIQLGFNKEKRLVVVAPLSGTPAEKAGIKPQDLIVEIDDKDTTSMTLPEAVKLIRGPKGSQVTLEIFREGEEETRTFTLTRDTIVVKSVELSFKNTETGKEVAIIKLSRFGERTKEEWEEAISDVISKDPQALILDVRNNPGGFLEGAVFIASEFLESGDIVIQENAKKERSPFGVNRTGRLLDKQMVVLINKGSASASEIVAGALRDRDRAKLVGEKTFGKGTIQEAQDLPGGTGIHITVAKWLTPNGGWVNDTQGLEPDVKIEEDKEDSTRDPQLEKALELLE